MKKYIIKRLSSHDKFHQTMKIMRITSFFLFLNVLFIQAGTSFSQEAKLTINLRSTTIKEACRQIERQSSYIFVFSDNIENALNKKINIEANSRNIKEVCDDIFSMSGLSYKILDKQVVVYAENAKNVESIVAKTAIFQQAQSKTITGRIVDEKGDPIIGASIIEKGTTNGTISDMDGKFSLNVKDDAVIRVSYVGYLVQEINTKGKKNFDVILKESPKALDEVVVVGYGTITKKDLSSSVSSLKSDQLVDRTSAFNILQGMAGKVAGVQNVSFSGKPGGASSLRIRGMGSINADSNPIYVLDGVVGVDPQIINPENVESIDILKDAAATAMYGAKGANGVVIITTKSGKKDKGTVVYNGKVGVGFLNRKLDLLDADEFMEVQKRAYAYSGKIMPHLITPMENLFYYSKDASGNYLRDKNGYLIASPKYDTDWQEAVTQNAVINDHNLSFSSGNEKTSVYANISYQDFQGLVKETYSKRYSGTINVQSDIKKWLNIQAILTTGSQKQNDMEGGFGHGPVRNIIEMPRIVPVKYEDGTWGRKNDYPLGEPAENPIRLLQDQKKIGDQNFSIFNLVSTIKFNDKLQLTVKGDMQTTNSRSISYAKAGLLDVSETNNGFADISNGISQKWSNEDYFTYNNNFFENQMSSNFVLGASWYYNHYESSSSGSENFFDDYFEYYNLGAGTTFHKPSSGMTQNTMNSFYFRMNHNLKDKYLLGMTLRMDGASNFGENNKYGFFPSVSAGWRISEEDFFGGAKKVINNLKLRGSYGEVGNASIPNYTTISSYYNNSTVFNKTLEPYVVLGNLGNKDLKWETSAQLDLGLDMGFLNNRIEFLIDFYNKSTKDLLFSKQVPFTTGYSTTWTNLGEIANKGFEFTLSSKNITNRDFSWSSDIVFSSNKVEVVDVNGETIDTGNGTIAREGEEWASYYVYNRIGTWGLNEISEAAVYGKKPGDLKYEDVNKDGIINDDDKKIMGNGLPKGDLTFINTFSYKGFSLMIDLNYRYGAKILGITTTMMENRQIYGNSVSSVLDAWTPEHQNTMIAAIRLPSDVNFGENEKDSRMIYNGDFLRIRNIMLTYDFSPKTLGKINFIKGLTLAVNVENAHVFTSYPGFDPEIGFLSTDNGQGIDFYSYPRPTTVSTNLKITF
jgi:TonB-linked SusC/RagA family outer membrane protein